MNKVCTWVLRSGVVSLGVVPLWVVSLGVVKVVRGVRRPVEVVPRGEVVLHEAGREAAEAMVGRGGLVEGRGLLVGGEGPSEVRGSLWSGTDKRMTQRQMIGTSIINY